MFEPYVEFLDLSGDAQVDALKNIKSMMIQLIEDVISGIVSKDVLIDLLTDEDRIMDFCMNCVFTEEGELLKPSAMLSDVQVKHKAIELIEKTYYN